jgi:sigma-E factor negative regulatory protein RseC
MEVLALNQVEAKPGDTVLLTTGSTGVVKGAALLYGLPLLGLIGGAIAGSVLNSSIGLEETAASVVFALAGLIVSVLALRAVSARMDTKGELVPVIERIVKPKTMGTRLISPYEKGGPLGGQNRENSSDTALPHSPSK